MNLPRELSGQFNYPTGERIVRLVISLNPSERGMISPYDDHGTACDVSIISREEHYRVEHPLSRATGLTA